MTPISEFLLGLSGFNGEEVLKTNSDNKKRNLSFRDIVHLAIIDEETIIKETSPVFNTNNMNEAAEGATFQLLVSGEDSSELIEIPDTTKRRNNLRAQIQLMDDMANDFAERIAEKSEEEKVNDVSMEDEIAKINDQYIEVQKNLEGKVQVRQQLWLEMESYKNNLLSIKELLIRFKLLKFQYESDLKRLNFIDEGEYLLSQLSSEDCRCPVCNSRLGSSEAISANFRDSITAEIRKIELNLSELNSTILTDENEKSELEYSVAEVKKKYSECEREITQNLEPFKTSIQSKLQDLVMKQDKVLNLNSLRKQSISISEKRAELIAQLDQLKNKDGSKGVINKENLASFVKLIQSFLVNWKYLSSNAVVDFDINWRVLDITIDGKPRSANGKGVRGLLYSAFVLALLKHCYDEGIAHPMMVMIDTPVKSFKEKDSGFEDPEKAEIVKNSFFESLSFWSKDMQVIIFENEEPPVSIKDKINYQHFSGTEGIGRATFIPSTKEK